MDLNNSVDRAKCVRAGIDTKTIEKLYIIDNEIIVTSYPILLDFFSKFWRIPVSERIEEDIVSCSTKR